MERAVWGLKMMGEPVVSVLSSRSSEIPGASEPGAEQMVKARYKMFYLNVSGLRMEEDDSQGLVQCPRYERRMGGKKDFQVASIS